MGDCGVHKNASANSKNAIINSVFIASRNESVIVKMRKVANKPERKHLDNQMRAILGFSAIVLKVVEQL